MLMEEEEHSRLVQGDLGSHVPHGAGLPSQLVPVPAEKEVETHESRAVTAAAPAHGLSVIALRHETGMVCIQHSSSCVAPPSASPFFFFSNHSSFACCC